MLIGRREEENIYISSLFLKPSLLEDALTSQAGFKNDAEAIVLEQTQENAPHDDLHYCGYFGTTAYQKRIGYVPRLVAEQVRLS